MLEKMRSNSAPSALAEGPLLKFDVSAGRHASGTAQGNGGDEEDKGQVDTFRVKETPRLLGGEGPDPFFAGVSNVRGLVGMRFPLPLLGRRAAKDTGR